MRPKILIVDDEPNNLWVMKKVLSPLNLDIHEATSGIKALEVAHKYDFFLILMDVQMPDMDGFEAASLILGNQKTSHIPIIFVTALAKDYGFEFKGYECGAIDYMVKPVNGEILKSKVNIFLEIFSSRKKIQKQSEEFEAFSNRVAHDLRNPIDVIVSMAQIMLKSLNDKDLVKNLAERILRSSERTMDIIEGIYDLSKLSNHEIDLKENKLSVLVNDGINSVQNLIEESSAIISVECEHSLKCSAFLVPQIFQNLISNSIKFYEGSSAPEIKIKSSQMGEKIILSFEDNGPGVPKEYRDSIFKAFERLHGQNVEGLGIGLSTIKSIVEAHNARIWVEDAAELGGACFMIEFDKEITAK